MDSTEYNIYLRALWAVPAILGIMDLDAMLAQARETGTDADVDLILALRVIKQEDYQR